MHGTTHVNLHCHTAFSDGTLSPEQVAERLAAANVAFASLTDHDTVDGLARFRQALARRGIGFITGLEMTTRCGDAEAHLLAYGFDPSHPELLATLASVRHGRIVDVESITRSMRQLGAGGASARSAAPDGRITTENAIALVHRAGGLAVLAHPLFLERDPPRLRELLAKLKEHGLDGIEAIYANFDAQQQQLLCGVADELGLLISAGTDFHAPGDPAVGIDMPAPRWKRFRDAIRSTATARAGAAGNPGGESQRPGRRHFRVYVMSPMVLAMALLAIAVVILCIADAKDGMPQIQRSMVRVAMIVSGMVALLLVHVMRESLRLERERRDVEGHLKDTTERYRSLVEAATEGTLLVLDGRCRYANPILLEMLGYSEHELELLDPADLIPSGPDNAAAWDSLKRLQNGEEPAGAVEGVLRRRDGSLVDCVLALSRISFAGRDGFILLVREARSHFAGGPEENPERWHRLAKVADGTTVALFRARAVRWGAIVEANREAVELFGPVQEGSTELSRSLGDLFGSEDEYAEFVKELEAEGSAERRLRVPGQGDRVRVLLLRAALRREESGAAIFIDGVAQDITAIVARESEREAVIQRLQTSLLFLHEPVRQLSRPAVSCGAETPIDDAAAVMAANESTCILVRESGREIGIVTDRDLRDRVLAAGVAAEEPVRRIMSSPLVTISERAQIYEAMLAMQRQNVQHLAIVDEAGRVVGVVRGKELLQAPGYGAIVLTREIAAAGSAEDVALCCRRVPALARTLLDCGAHPRNITRMVASVCDAATEWLVSLALAELGPAPAPFAFVALGSQGRQEQTLFTDQDNAIIYAAREGDAASPGEYFRQLGSRVCAWLDHAGYALCRGGIMAGNPRWVQPLAAWEQYFDGWVSRAEPQELLEFSIFFDLRCVCGERGLVRELRTHVRATLKDCPAFYPQFAQNALQFRPPLRLFGKILGGGHTGESAGLNLKDAMLPIVNFARLYALQHEISETHTLDRLGKLAAAGVLLPSSHDEIAAAYDFLMRLRLRRQAAAIQAGEPPDNTINHRKLGHLDEAMLKQSFAQIDAVQKRISLDFLGGR
ncbi:MAG: DUF294 nucleotidyltransferase-like domain-containing protein [Tepidisphaerales bacterium]